MEEVETEILKNEPVREENSTKCRCIEMEERCKKAEAKIVELDLEIGRRKEEYDALQAKFKELNAQKDAIKDENKDSDKEVKEGNRVVDLTKDGNEEEGEDLIDELIAENCVSDCEKKKPESDVKVWKEKFKELELQVSQVDESNTLEGIKEIKGENRPQGRIVMEQPQIKEKSVDLVDLGAATASIIPSKSDDDLATGTPSTSSPFSCTSLVSNEGVCLKSEGGRLRKARRHISFEERSSSKKMDPSTLGNSKTACHNVINIFDSDDESDIHLFEVSTPCDQKSRISKDHAVALKRTAHDQGKEECSDESDLQFFKVSTPSYKKNRISKDHMVALKRTAHDQGKEECLEDCIDDIPCVPTPKTKRAAKIVNSDTESDDEDVPILKLKQTDVKESTPDKVNGVVTRSKRRVATLRHCEGKIKEEMNYKTDESKQGRGISTMEDDGDGESEEVGSESEGESLGGFIVESSESDESDSSNGSNQSGNDSDDDVNFDDILSELKRSKNRKLEWELEADMLSAFGKDLELCMKAVCALYRQQTSEEQASKETMVYNYRGFSKFDALRGSKLAEFLTDGDPHGDLKKSVQQLEKRGSKEVELCRRLASHYSKQLFAIYKNKEDPLFLPS